MNRTELLKKHEIKFDADPFDSGSERDKLATLKERRGDIVVEATRVILNEQFDKMAAATISKVQSETVAFRLNTFGKPCRIDLDWKNEELWAQAAKNPNNNEKRCDKTTNEAIEIWRSERQPPKLAEILKINTIKSGDDPNKKRKNRELCRKCFAEWRRLAIWSRNKGEIENKIAEHKAKIDKFIEVFEKRENRNNKKQAEQVENCNNRGDPECFKNRFKAQREIIEAQKAKIMQQTKIIEEMKLGKLHEDVVKSLEESKVEIREVYVRSSAKVKCKLAPPPEENREKLVRFLVTSKRAPKFIQKMEARAQERAKKRQIILERKRVIDEQKRRLLEEAAEKKRAQDEEETRRNLDAMRERRRKELEAEKLRQENKRIYLEQSRKAQIFRERNLQRVVFAAFVKLVEMARENEIKSEEFYEKSLKTKAIRGWLRFLENKYREKNVKADNFHAEKLRTAAFKAWKNFWRQAIQDRQVAEDLYELKLQSKTFLHWHLYVCKQYISRERLLKMAERHYRSRILLQYFYQWRSLPAVLQLEKAKEAKKKRWREKVLEILPDYKPPESDFSLIS